MLIKRRHIFLGGLISIENVSRRRLGNGKGPYKLYFTKYKIRIASNETLVCKRKLCWMFGIGKLVVERICPHNIILVQKTNAVNMKFEQINYLKKVYFKWIHKLIVFQNAFHTTINMTTIINNIYLLI